jgi:nitrogen-specific signal transduction histidine kinase/ActR/RegA family two-component response regulator
VFRIAGVAEDVTARRAIEEQFRQSQKLEAIGQLAGGIAHDFNNLLTVINGYTQVLLAEGRDPSAQRDLEQIQHAGTRAASLTRQLLAFGRQSILEVTVLDLSRLLTQAEKILERVLRGDIVLTIETAASLYRVKADPGQIERVIINLAVNARDAMPQGGRLTLGTRNVELATRDLVDHPGASAGRYAVLSVSDTGSGMTELVKARLFEPFFTTKGADRGTGLGLAVVDGVIRQSGGFIEVDSAPGRGTTFRIYLPAIEGLEPDVVDEAVEGPEAGSETVVLAEDDEAVRQFAGTALRRLGYRVLVAIDGADAVELIRHAAQPIALLVTDLVMPGLNGPQVIEVLRKEGRAPHVLFISGYAPETVMQREITSGAVNFLRKPFTAVTLARKVREVLDTRS